MALHEQLKQEKQINKFYDEIRKAKDKAYKMINECIQTKETLPVYQDVSKLKK